MHTSSMATGSRPLLLALLLSVLAAACGVSDPQPKPPIAKFNVGCVTIVDSLVEFTNNSAEATRYRWEFGNGATSTERTPTTRYTATGNYQVTLVAESDAGERDTLTKTITIAEAIPPSKVLDIPFRSSQSVGWSWAAISEMILRYKGINTSQCEIQNAYYSIDCCNRPADCRLVGSLRQIELDLLTLGKLESEHQFSPLTLEQIRIQIAQGNPVVAGYERTGYLHAVLIYGYDAAGYVMVHDPLTGSSTIPYNDALRYGGGSNYLEWNESTFCFRE